MALRRKDTYFTERAHVFAEMTLASQTPKDRDADFAEKTLAFLLFSRPYVTGADPGEVKWVNFHPPFFESPSNYL